MLGFLFNPGAFSTRVRLGWFQHAIYRYHPQPPNQKIKIMKNLLSILIIISSSSCAYKPYLLEGEITKHEIDTCFQLGENMERKQNIYQITGGRDDIHRYNEHYYYYYLTDYINNGCPESDYKIMLLQTKVGLIYQTYSKGKSYDRLVFEVRVNLYKGDQLIKSKQYSAESKSDVVSFTTSKVKTAKLTSKALSEGYQNILQQISEDISRLDSN